MVGSAVNPSPKILSLGWGKMVVESIGKGKDFKLWPGGGRSWDWGESGTKHSPGIQASDCRELVEHGSRFVVLSRGVFKRLKVSPGALDYLEENGLEVICLETKKAVQHYNLLAERGEKVGGLFHTTC